MSSKYKNRHRQIQQNLSINLYVFLSYSISNAKHIHFISGGRVTQAKCLHGKYSSRLGDIPPLSAGSLPRQVTQLHHVNSHPGLLLVSIKAGISPLPSNSPCRVTLVETSLCLPAICSCVTTPKYYRKTAIFG
jgi:hypothetical protein